MFSNSKIIVNSDRKIDDNNDLDIDYYLLYEDFCISFNNHNFYLSDKFFSSNIILGRNVENSFEILLSSKNKDLLNKRIILKINNNKYKFLVVGIYQENYVINSNYIFTTGDTLDILYDFNAMDNYKYIFVVDNYSMLNFSIDSLVKYGYDLSIYDNEDLFKLNNYNTLNDVVMLFIIILLSIILIFIVYVIF